MDIIDYCDFDAVYTGRPVGVRQMPYPHPYKRSKRQSGRNDLTVFCRAGSIFVQVKHQEASGSAYEKIPDTFNTARYALGQAASCGSAPFTHFWLVFTGREWARLPDFLNYCRNHAAKFDADSMEYGWPVQTQVIHGPRELTAAITEQKRKGLFKK
jgi:hypothetical protein